MNGHWKGYAYDFYSILIKMSTKSKIFGRFADFAYGGQDPQHTQGGVGLARTGPEVNVTFVYL